MKKFLDEYFTFSKRDRNGVLWLCLILVSAIAYKYVVDCFPEEPISIEVKNSDIDVSQVPSQYTEKRSSTPELSRVKSDTPKSEKLFLFDPNTLDEEGWQDLGFSSRQVSMISKYRQNGGRFDTPEDVLKLYCVDEKRFEDLRPFIKITPVSAETKTEDISSSRKKAMSFELNRADTNQLKSVRGIGSFYARKIVELREELGGYHSWDQLLQVWKMKPETIESLQKAATLNPNLTVKLSINDLTKNQLAAHPNISWKQARAIVSYRDQHGAYQGWDDLMQCHLVDSAFRVELKPYFGFDVRRPN